MPENKRHHLRLPVESTVFIELESPRVGSDEPGTIARCKTLDVSRRGLRVSLEHELVAGAILQIGVDLHATVGTLYLAGEVRWCRPNPAPDTGWSAGFALLNAGDSDIDSWVSLLTEMDS